MMYIYNYYHTITVYTHIILVLYIYRYIYSTYYEVSLFVSYVKKSSYTHYTYTNL